MFRPCIDLHQGKVKQIVGGSLSDDGSSLQTNFTSDRPSEWFADLYRKDGLPGGHVIKLGPGNDLAARAALNAYPNGLQLGGGINLDNARSFLEEGASHVIVTSWLFEDGEFQTDRLKALAQGIGKSRLVIDLSCRVKDEHYYVVTNRWQTFSTLKVTSETLEHLAQYCDEFLIHAADVEGLCGGIDLKLVKLLSESAPIPTTYAGGAKSVEDLQTVHDVSAGRVDLTIGSALDIFGGSGLTYSEAIAFNQRQLKLKAR